MSSKAERPGGATPERARPVNITFWKRFRYWLEWTGLSLLASLIPCLSRAHCVVLSRTMGTLAFRLDGRGRAVALANLEAAFGETYTVAQRRQIACESYRQFIRTMIDLFWTPRLSAANRETLFRVEGFEAMLRNHAASPAGSVFMCVHLGNFEWASLACGFHGVRATIVAEEFKNPLLARVFNRLRESSGHQLIAQDRSVLRLLKTVKRGGVAGLLIDLTLRPTQPSVAIDAFGMKMCVTLLHAVLARRTGALLVPIESIPEADGTCRIIAHAPLQFSADATETQIAQGCWDFFEPRIRAAPERWMWAYKHWRYQPGGGQGYPFYANRSGSFEKLLRQEG